MIYPVCVFETVWLRLYNCTYRGCVLSCVSQRWFSTIKISSSRFCSLSNFCTDFAVCSHSRIYPSAQTHTYAIIRRLKSNSHSPIPYHFSYGRWCVRKLSLLMTAFRSCSGFKFNSEPNINCTAHTVLVRTYLFTPRVLSFSPCLINF